MAALEEKKKFALDSNFLLDIDEVKLLTAFNDSDLMPVRAFHPKNLLKAVGTK